jgi:SAM-dependent methyltransferase
VDSRHGPGPAGAFRGFPLPLQCPVCRNRLAPVAEGEACPACGRIFGSRGPFLDLVVGDRFEDRTDDAQMLYEEQSNADLTRSYLIPLFRRLWPKRSPAPRLLSLGCGTGSDVDLLCEEGYDCVGIDCGNRVAAWSRRRHPERLLMANGQHLPFEDAAFDGVFCGCVFPHVGVVGDSYQVTARFREDRLALGRELSRVTRPGGKIVVSSPNRRFPLDIFHGRAPGRYRPRLYWPGDPFLLSVADYRSLFDACGCPTVITQPVERYWSFRRSRLSWKGRLLGSPLRLLFWLLSRDGLRGLRGSPADPWLVLLVEKGAPS